MPTPPKKNVKIAHLLVDLKIKNCGCICVNSFDVNLSPLRDSLGLPLVVCSWLELERDLSRHQDKGDKTLPGTPDPSLWSPHPESGKEVAYPAADALRVEDFE